MRICLWNKGHSLLPKVERSLQVRRLIRTPIRLEMKVCADRQRFSAEIARQFRKGTGSLYFLEKGVPLLVILHWGQGWHVRCSPKGAKGRSLERQWLNARISNGHGGLCRLTMQS